jgi:mRNA interferase MazF
MNLKRGDIALARFPHAAGARGKKRPVVVVQADAYNQKLRHVIVAEITTNRSAGLDPANLFVEVATPAVKPPVWPRDSVITGLQSNHGRARVRKRVSAA